MKVKDFTFNTSPVISFGAGKISEAGKTASKLGSKALLITGKSFLRESGLLDKILNDFYENDIKVVLFDDVPPEPLLINVAKAVDVCSKNECNLIVGVGGGSVLDVAKTAAVLADKQDSVDVYFSGKHIESKGLPYIAIPTTAGTGSEVTPNAVLIDTDASVKASIRSEYMIADSVIIDPEFLIKLPPRIKAYSGMDALTQAIESYISIGAFPLTESLSLGAASLLINNLQSACRNSNEMTFNANIALGSLMGGIAFANAKLGLVHGLAHPLGILSGLPHGLICGLLLPVAIEFNAPAAGKKLANLSRYAGLSHINGSDDQAYNNLLCKIRTMNDDMELSMHKKKLIPEKSKWDNIVSQTLASGSTKSNPRKVMENDITNILEIITNW